MKVVSFKIQLLGEKDIISKSKKITEELLENVNSLKEFDKATSTFKKASIDAAKLQAELRKVNVQLKGMAAKLAIKPPKADNEGVKKLAKDYDALVQQAKALNKENNRASDELRILQKAAKLAAGSQDDGYKAVIARIAELKIQQKGVTDEIKKQTKEFEEQKFAVGSYRALNSQLGKLRTSYRDAGKEFRNSVAGKAQLAQIKDLDRELKRIDKTMGISVRNVGNYRDAIRGVATVISRLGALSIAGVGAQELVEVNADISDSIADVRKTTQLSRGDLEGYGDAINELTDNLKQLDTRTSLADLLDISRIGGQLGIGSDLVAKFKEAAAAGNEIAAQGFLDDAKAELEGFTAAIDQVNVALGDDLEGGVEGISSDLGKLNELLGVRGELGVSQGILAIGSAINTLGASGTAQGSKIVDFTKRLAGIAPQANISAADLLGLGAALDEFGQSPEVSASALTQLLVLIGEDVPKFAKIAGKSVEEFTATLQENGNEGLLQVVEGAGAAEGGIASLAKQLEQFGISGVRSTAVLGALTKGADRVREVQKLSADQFAIARGEIEATLSVTEEFNVKNETLGAEIDKLKNTLINFVVSTGFQEFLANSIKGLSKFVVALANVPQYLAAVGKFLKDNRGLLIAFTGALIIYNASLLASTALQIKNAFATLQLSLANIRKAAADRVATISQWNLNAALSANPIGVVIGLIALLVGGIVLLVDNYDAIAASVKKAWQQVSDFGEGTGVLNKIVYVLTANIRAAIFVVQNFGSIWAAVGAAAKQAVTNITSGFSGLVASAKIVGLELKQVFTFDSNAEERIQGEIDALKKVREAAEKESKPVASAFAEEFARSQKENAEKALQAQRESDAKFAAEEAKRNREARIADEASRAESNKSELDDKKKQAGSLADFETAAEKKKAEAKKKAEEKAAAKRKKRNEEILREQEAAGKARFAAAQKIAELEAQNSGDEFTRSVEGEAVSAQGDIGKLVGDPEQIERQTELIREKLAISLESLFADQRTTIAEKALEQVEELGGAGGLLPTPEGIQEQADAISESLEAEQTALFDQQNELLVSSAEATIKSLVGDPETIALQSEVIREQLLLDQEALRVQKEAFSEQELADEELRQAKVRQLQVDSLDQRFSIDESKRAEALALKIASISSQVEEEKIATDAAKELIELAEEEAKEAELAALKDHEDNKAALLIEGSQELLDLKKTQADRELALSKEKNEELIANEEKLQETKRKATEAQLDFVEGLVTGAKDLLSQDEENKKKHAKFVKALSIGEVVIGLIREVSGIKASNSVYPEPFGSIIKAATVAKAVISAGIAVQKINAEEFEFGGSLGESETPKPKPGGSLSSSYVGTDGKLISGDLPTSSVNELLGQSQGSESSGAAYIGGDGKLYPSSESDTFSPIVSMSDAMENPGIHAGLNGYKKKNSLFVTGQGYIPDSSGLIIGASHVEGGIRAVNKDGKVVEVEGGEYLLKNGAETYIINKRSTAMFRPQLLAMGRSANTYSPVRRELASRINQADGKGRSFSRRRGTYFEDGGVLQGLPQQDVSSVALATTIVAPPPTNVPSTNTTDPELMKNMMAQNKLLQGNIDAVNKKADAIRKQLLTLQLTVDAKKLVEKGLEEIQEEENDGSF